MFCSGSGTDICSPKPPIHLGDAALASESSASFITLPYLCREEVLNLPDSQGFPSGSCALPKAFGLRVDGTNEPLKVPQWPFRDEADLEDHALRPTESPFLIGSPLVLLSQSAFLLRVMSAQG